MARSVIPRWKGELRSDIIYDSTLGTAQQATKKYSLVEADKTLSEQWYDHTDPDNVVPLVKTIADLPNIDNDQQFVNTEDILKSGFYSQSIEEPCYTEVNKFFDFVEPLYDSEGDLLRDIDGSILYALKEGVERTA